MKKRILTIVMVVMMLFNLVGCSTSSVENVNENQPTSMFVLVENTASWRIVYHKETKVMYAVSASSYNYGNFTLLINSDGTPMLYEE